MVSGGWTPLSGCQTDERDTERHRERYNERYRERARERDGWREGEIKSEMERERQNSKAGLFACMRKIIYTVYSQKSIYSMYYYLYMLFSNFLVKSLFNSDSKGFFLSARSGFLSFSI